MGGGYTCRTMKTFVSLLLMMAVVPATGQTDHASMKPAEASSSGAERLGHVEFPVSCAAGTQVSFNRGVALLHNFWYEEAGPQFKRIAASDPGCAMAHWGSAMSMFHEIWDRPNPETMKLGWAEMEKAQALKPKTEREQAYVAALAGFYKPGPTDFQARVESYSAAMGRLYAAYPEDVDAGAFYALSVLAAEKPDDMSLSQRRSAMNVLQPLFVKDADNPGVDHYIVHACDNPLMAAEGLAAADHYGPLAASGPHAYHMPGHIYARLGLWQKDIDSQTGSIRASQAAESKHENGLMDEPHSYDFLMYAYLQSGQDALAKVALQEIKQPLKTMEEMPGMGMGHKSGMVPYYRTKLEVFYSLEMRDWKTAGALQPVAGSPPEVDTLVYWAKAVAHGHLKEGAAARSDLAKFDHAVEEVKKGPHAYYAEGPGFTIVRDEMAGWAAYAEGKEVEAAASMKAAADLQDQVGQAEVDIPAREMRGDLLLAEGHAGEALADYEVALKLSPNRLNGLYGAGHAAEAAGEKEKAASFYAALLKGTGGGKESARPELAHAREYVAGSQVAER